MELDLDIYPIEAIRLACNNLANFSFFFIHNDKSKKSVTLEIKPKNNLSKKKIEEELLEELIACSVYLQQSKKNKEIKEILLKKILSSSLEFPNESKTFYFGEKDLQ